MERRHFLQLAGTGAFASLAQADSTKPMSFLRESVRARNQNRSTVVSQRGMVCTSHPLASQAGLDLLKKGGNAVDAAICANAMLGLVEPASCGLGGDLFAIVWSAKDGKLLGLNASGRAPYDWNLEEAAKLSLKSIERKTPLSWSVPGCVSGWGHLSKRLGKLPFAETLAPTIDYARAGFPLSPIIGASWPQPSDAEHESLLATYAANGQKLGFGDVFRNPDLANTLAILARDGAESFYQGEIAERIVRFSQSLGGRFSLRDFHDHAANWVEPVSAGYRGYDVWELPPNGQGIAALQILNMLETFDIGSLRPNSAEHLHLFIEAKKLAYEDRAIYYADMDFAKVPLAQLISKSYGQERAKLINPKKAAAKVAPGRLTGSSDTVYLTAADADGNMISLIQSNFNGFGSGYVPDHLGFPLQNRGQLFSLNPEDLNKLEPHKRPFQTIIPAFLTREGRPVMSFGVMGGDFQPQGHVQVLINMIDHGMSPQSAGEQPRVQHSESSEPTGKRSTGPGLVSFEEGIPDSVKLRLAEMGHDLSATTDAFGGYQAIWRMDEPLRYFGGSDPRKDGCAVGF